MKDWENAADKFLKNWQNKKEVVGAILAGSYVSGNNTKFSDIDIHIILSEKTNWRMRGNKIIDGFVIEYFANPIPQLKKYQIEDYKNNARADARMFATGKIVFDKLGVVKKLQKEAKKQITKEFQKKDKIWIESKKYFLWDQLDNLKDIAESSSESFAFVYYNTLYNIIDIYGRFIKAEIPPISKLYKIFINEEFRKKYQIVKFPDQNFIIVFKKCIEKQSLENISELTDYVSGRMGKINIDGWKLKTPAQK